MEALTPWLTPALLVASFTWLRFDLREQRREINGGIDGLSKRFDDVNKRFDAAIATSRDTEGRASRRQAALRLRLMEERRSPHA